ncbi:MAG: glycosyltransferase family 4 protein [Myxococcales bacterium]|nr:glycosyltransferase family 4 protein [Myxococcales bacterium]
MRVLQLIKIGTGATWAERQIAQLVAHGVELHVAVPDGPMVARYRAAGATVHIADVGASVRHPGRSVAAAARLRALVAEIRPELIHSHFVSTTLTMRLALGPDHPIPRVFQVPGPLHLEHPVTRAGELAVAGPADYWIGSCEWTCRRYLASGIEPSRVFHSVYGVDVEQFVPRRAPGQLRAEHRLAPDSHLVGLVAFMYAPRWWLGQRAGLKGHEDLIEALARVRARGHDVIGVFVGGAWAGAVDYERRVRALGRARLGDAALFLGTRTDVPDLYAEMELVVHPSHSENLGGASESLLLGRPTIATRVGGLPDLVRDGETGWLVPPRSPGALADTIVEALASPERARRLATAGEALAREVMDVRRTGAEVARIYHQIVSGHRRGRR